MQFLQWIQLLATIFMQCKIFYTYLLRVELYVFAYIMTDDCNTDMLSVEHWL